MSSDVVLKKEVRIFLYSDEKEFEAERIIVHNVVVPQLRKYCTEELNTDLVVLDPFETSPGLKIPTLDYSVWSFQLQECSQISDATALLVFVGDRYGGPFLPTKLREKEFTNILNFMKNKKNPVWLTFQKSYTKLPDVFRLNELDPDEYESLLSQFVSIQPSMIEEGALTAEEWDNLCLPGIEKIRGQISSSKTIASRCISVVRNLKDPAEFGNQAGTDVLKSRLLDVGKTGVFKLEKVNIIADVTADILKELPRDNYLKFALTPSMLEEYRDLLGLKSSAVKNSVLQRLHGLILENNSPTAGYLATFAKQLYDRLKTSVIKLSRRNDFCIVPLLKEIETHRLAFVRADMPAKVLYRDRENKILFNYLCSQSQLPGLLYGDSGSGKTVLLNVTMAKISSMFSSSYPIVIKRSGGLTSLSCTLQQILVSITEEICYHTKKKPPSTCEYAVCVYNFWNALQQATARQPIILIIDNVDFLYPLSHVEIFRWLPVRLPTFVKVIMACGSESVFMGFKKRFDESSTITVPGIPSQVLIQDFPKQLAAKGKQISEKNMELVNTLLQSNSTPLFNKVLLDLMPVKEDKLSDRTKLLFMKRLEQLELKHSVWLVKHFMSYMASSRFGLSLIELIDIMSLDNFVAQESGLDFKQATFFRVPMSLIQQLFSDVRQYLLVVQYTDRHLYIMRNAAIRNAVIDYYQLTKEFGSHIHQQMSEYWLGKWGTQKTKPLHEKSQTEIYDDSKSINMNRLTPLQVYYRLQPSGLLLNERKLDELPLQLLKAEKVTELYRSCLFSFEYLYSKLNSSTMNDLISECYFLRQNLEVRGNQELEVLISLLRLLTGVVESGPDLLGIELSGRLCHMAGTQLHLTNLIQQIDAVGSRINSLLPALACFPTAEVDEVKVQLVNDGSKKNIICALSPDNRFLATLLPFIPDVIVYVWDAKSATKSQIINLGNRESEIFQEITYMPQSDENLIIKYRNPGQERCGFYFLNMNTGAIENNLEFKLSDRPEIMYLAKSYLALQVNGKIKMYQHPSAALSVEFKSLTWPFLITPSDKYIIAPRSNRRAADSGRLDTNLKVIILSTGDTVCNLECSLHSSVMCTNTRNEIFYIGSKNSGNILRYDFGGAIKRDIKKIKPMLELTLDGQATLPEEVRTLYQKYKALTSVVQMFLSVDEKSLLVEYNINEIKSVYIIWSISLKTVQAVILKPGRDVTRFSTDGQFVYQFVPNSESYTSFVVYSCSTGEMIQEIRLDDKIHDMYLMKDKQVLVVFPQQLILTSLKNLAERCDSKETPITAFTTALKMPKYHSDLNIIYHNNPKVSDFSYYNLDSGALLSTDIAHNSSIINKYPVQRDITSDGVKLILTYTTEATRGVRIDRQESISQFVKPQKTKSQLINQETDFRKPEIPGVNYFTGNFFSTVKTSVLPDPYRQFVVRIYEISTGRLISQVSLTGEKIVHVTDSLFLTIKPDHASVTRSSPEANDLISVYDLASGNFQTVVYLHHKIIHSQLVANKTRLFVCCGHNGTCIKIIGGVGLDKELDTIDLDILIKAIDEYARSPSVREIALFGDSDAAVLVHYGFKESDNLYSKIDLRKKLIIASFSAADIIQDVTRDGKLGIDKGLRLYDLNRGDLLKQLNLAYTTESQSLESVSRFVDDGSLIIVLNNALNSLTVLENDAKAKVVGRAILHRMKPDSQHQEPFQLVLGSAGRVIVLANSAEYKVFVIRHQNKDKRIVETVYHSVLDRTRAIMPSKKFNNLDSIVIKANAVSVSSTETAKIEEPKKAVRKGRSSKTPTDRATPVADAGPRVKALKG